MSARERFSVLTRFFGLREAFFFVFGAFAAFLFQAFFGSFAFFGHASGERVSHASPKQSSHKLVVEAAYEAHARQPAVVEPIHAAGAAHLLGVHRNVVAVVPPVWVACDAMPSRKHPAAHSIHAI